MRSYDVVIVNFNGEKIISKCLESVYKSSLKPSRVIIYDNASHDKSVETIRREFPQVKLIVGASNIGFGRANNEAMKFCDDDLILFMNNDVILDEDCSRVLSQQFEDKKMAIVNPIIFTGWKKEKNAPVYSFGAKMNTSGFGYGLFDQDDDRDDLNCFSGACFMASAKIIKSFQFEKRFFLYYEEPELSTRISIAGFKIGRVKEAKCYHLENYSSPRKRADGICFRQFYAIQNRSYMLGKYWPPMLLLKAFPLNAIHILYNTLFFIVNGQPKRASIIYLAVTNFFAGRRSFDKSEDRQWIKRLTSTRMTNAFKLMKKVYR